MSASRIEFEAGATGTRGIGVSGGVGQALEQHQVEPVSLLPAQFFTRSDWRDLARGEVALCGAILADAIECFHAYGESRDVERRRLARQAERWLFSDLPDAPFSMERVCDALGIDPEDVRRSLARRVGGRVGTSPRLLAQRFVRGAGRRRLRA